MIYLDHAATTPTDPRVLAAMMPYLSYDFGNPGSMHEYGRSAKAAVDRAREQAAGFFNCDPGQVIFTSGGSEGNNLIIKGLLREIRLRERNTIAVSKIEHDSVRNAARQVQMRRFQEGIHACEISVTSDGEVLPDSLESLPCADTLGLVSVMLANNETGILNNIPAIANWCSERGILCHSDAVQAAGIHPLDTSEFYQDVDFMTVSGHKIGGPKGTGAIFAREPKLLMPLISGGAEQEFGFRGGTENVAGIVGFGEACALAKEEYIKHFLYLQKQHSQLIFRLKTLAAEKNVEMRINGDVSKMLPKTLNVCFPGVDAQSLLLMLDSVYQICVSAGSACRAHENEPSHVLKAMGLSDEDARSSVRISISHLNREEELDTAAQNIIDCVAALKSL